MPQPVLRGSICSSLYFNQSWIRCLQNIFTFSSIQVQRTTNSDEAINKLQSLGIQISRSEDDSAKNSGAMQKLSDKYYTFEGLEGFLMILRLIKEFSEEPCINPLITYWKGVLEKLDSPIFWIFPLVTFLDIFLLLQ